MNVQNPLYRAMLFIEVAVAFTYPCIVLIFGTFIGIFWIATSLTQMRVEAMLLLSLIMGGYMGLIVFLHQLSYLLNNGRQPPGWKTFAYILIGGFAVLPFFPHYDGIRFCIGYFCGIGSNNSGDSIDLYEQIPAIFISL